MTTLHIESRNFANCSRSEEQYGEWYDENNIQYLECSITDSKYGSPIDFNVEVGDTVYYVYVDYNTGDSFGHASNCHCEIGIYKTVEEANKVAKIIINDAEKDNHEPLDIGAERPISTWEWKGYFETFNSCNVEPLVVGR